AATFLIKELGLSDAQQVQYKELRHQHREMLDKLDEQDKELHKRFFDLLLLEKADSVSVEALADSIAANRKQMEIVTYDHFFRINKILNPEQQKKFTLIFKDVLRMVLPPLPPPPGQLPPPPPPPPPAPAPKK
ncbi:MAG: Spy/CpxP family protein refolding chaperone, partial [Bacteroidetes bacterium]|nr:Spy/CpxP family protein refolding chaperone [Bacteroidota bacterium]